MIKNFALIYPLAFYVSLCTFDVLRTFKTLCAPSMVRVESRAEPMTHEAFQTHVNDNLLFVKSPAIFTQQMLKVISGSWAWRGLPECSSAASGEEACIQSIPAAADILKSRVAVLIARITSSTFLLLTSLSFLLPIHRKSKLSVPLRPFIRFRDALSRQSFATGRCIGAGIVSTILIGVTKTVWASVSYLGMYMYSKSRVGALMKPVENLESAQLASLATLKAWMQQNPTISGSWAEDTKAIVDLVASDKDASGATVLPALQQCARLLVHNQLCQEIPATSLIPRMLNALSSRHADRVAMTSLVAITAFPHGIDIASGWMAPWLCRATSREQADVKAVIVSLTAVLATGYCLAVLLLLEFCSYIYRGILCGLANALVLPTGVLSSAGYVLQELACAGHTHEFATNACRVNLSQTFKKYIMVGLVISGALAASSVLFTYQQHYDPKQKHAKPTGTALIRLKITGAFVALFTISSILITTTEIAS